MKRRDSLDQLRRLLLLAVELPAHPGLVPQLDLFFGPEDLPDTQPSTGMVELSVAAHALLIELLILIRMEKLGLVDTPLRTTGRRRLGLGSMPALRLIDEWESTPPEAIEPWRMANPWPGREAAYAAGIAHARWLSQTAGTGSARLRELVRRLYPIAIRGRQEEDLAGLLHSHGARHTIGTGPTGRAVFRRDRDRMRGNGLVSTPEDLATELTGILIREADPDNGSLMVDPACGSGPFLLAAAAIQASAAERKGNSPRENLERRLLSLYNLYGVDIDPIAVRIAALNLSLWAAQEADAAGAEYLDSLFGVSFPYFLGTRIQTGNALLQEPSSFSPGFIWERRFPEVFDRERPGFDIVFGNPPWISYGLRDRTPASGEERAYYERLYPAGTQYKLTLYPLFMELALKLCRKGGVHGFLVPDSVLTGHHFSRIRKLLLTATDLVELLLVEGGIWQDASTGYALVYAARMKGGSRSAPVSVRNRVVGRGNGGEQKGVWVPAASYSAAGSAPLRVFRDDGELAFLARIQESPFRFRDVTWTYSGLIGRHGQKSIQSDRPDGEFVVQDRHGSMVLEDRAAVDRWRPALLSGGEVTPFSIRWRGGHVYLPEDRESLTRIYKSGFDLTRYSRPKVFLRQTGDCLIAARDVRGLYCLNNLHIMGTLDWAGIDPLLLTGILTSEPVQKAYRIFSLERSRPLAQVDLKIVEELPYPSDSGGVPVGAGRPVRRSLPQAKGVVRLVDRAIRDGAHRPLLELAEGAWTAGADPLENGPMTGREVLTVLLLRLLERIEAVTGPGNQGQTRPGRQGSGRNGQTGSSSDMLDGYPDAGYGPQGSPQRSRRDPGSPEVLRSLLDQIIAVMFQLSGSQA